MNFYQSILNELESKKRKLEEAIESSRIMITEAEDRVDEANSDERTELARHNAKLDKIRRDYEDSVASENLKHQEQLRKIELFRNQALGEIDNRKAWIPNYEQEILDVKDLINQTKEKASNDKTD